MVFFTFKILWVSGEQEEDGGGPGEGKVCGRCFSGAPRRSTCPSYLMKRPLPMNLVTGSRLAPWQRNASFTGIFLPRPSPISFRPPYSALFPVIHSIPQPTPSPSSPKSDVSSTPRSRPAEPAQNPADAFPHAARSILPYQ